MGVIGARPRGGTAGGARVCWRTMSDEPQHRWRRLPAWPGIVGGLAGVLLGIAAIAVPHLADPHDPDAMELVAYGYLTLMPAGGIVGAIAGHLIGKAVMRQ